MTLVWKKYQIFSRPAQIFLDALRRQIELRLKTETLLKLSVFNSQTDEDRQKNPADVGSFYEIHRLIFRSVTFLF